MEIKEYEVAKKQIKRNCRIKFGLAMGGLAGLLIGGKFALKTLDIDIREYPWGIISLPVYFGIGYATNHYARKEPKELSKLTKKFEESQEDI